MIELYIVGGAGLVILFLWVRNGSLKKEVEAQTTRAVHAEKVAEVTHKVAETMLERTNNQPERVKEIVQDAIDDDFSDFYSDNDT